jgi:short-subunit dehydrogenase
MPVMALPPPSIDTTVLVTGASAGIGAELARELARRSYNIALVARRAERMQELAEELRLSHGVHADVEPCDLSVEAARRELVERLEAGARKVVGVCNNAGLGTVATLLEAGVEREQQVVRLNIEAVHHLTGAFLPRMVEDGAGAKSFSEAVHEELRGTGVSVTCLFPGFTHTEFGAKAGAADKERKLPELLWMEAPDVARTGVEAMVAGRRTAIPGLTNRATMLGGRVMPRTVLLPLVRQFTGR